jgi:hypothetical protein
LNPNLIVDFVILAGFEAPFFLARRCIERIKEAVPTAYVNDSCGDSRRCMNNIASLKSLP